jgi:hypothetical protein
VHIPPLNLSSLAPISLQSSAYRLKPVPHTVCKQPTTSKHVDFILVTLVTLFGLSLTPTFGRFRFRRLKKFVLSWNDISRALQESCPSAIARFAPGKPELTSLLGMRQSPNVYLLITEADLLVPIEPVLISYGPKVNKYQIDILLKSLPQERSPDGQIPLRHPNPSYHALSLLSDQLRKVPLGIVDSASPLTITVTLECSKLRLEGHRALALTKHNAHAPSTTVAAAPVPSAQVAFAPFSFS